MDYMEDEQVSIIRETSRNVLSLKRRKLRDEESDVRRSMGNARVSTACVADIAKKLKTKSAVSVIELQTLKNALMDDSNNIEMVLNTDGALRGLVREISGNDVRRQCAAAGCCCNLALGDGRAGLAIAKAAGPYLVTSLDSLTTELAVTSAWTLGNLAGSGPKACEVATIQGAIDKLTEQLCSCHEDMRDAAAYALVHFAYQMKDDFRIEFVNKILLAASQIPITTTSSQLLFIISCHKDFRYSITQEFLQKLLETLAVSMEMHLNSCKTQPCCQLVNLLRFLGNIESADIYSVIINFFIVNNLCVSFKRLLQTDLKESAFWLLGNLFKFYSDSEFFVDLLS